MTRAKIKSDIKPRYISQHDAEVYSGCSRDKLAKMRINGLKVIQDEKNGMLLYDIMEIDSYMKKHSV